MAEATPEKTPHPTTTSHSQPTTSSPQSTAHVENNDRINLQQTRGQYAPGMRPQEAIALQRALGNRATQRLLRRSPSPSARSQILQRYVEGFGTATLSEKSIRGVLADEGLDSVYQLPEDIDSQLRKGTTSLGRTTQAKATISANTGKKGRGTVTGDYKDVGALGRWERLAVSHQIADKTIDTGHLIADEFFDEKQKASAYEARNLAPQNAVFNEEAYREFVERPVGENIKPGSTAKVDLEVQLAYDGDPLNLPVKVLVDRGALQVIRTPHAQAEHLKPTINGKVLNVPRRMPTKWVPKVTPNVTKPAAIAPAPVFGSQPFAPHTPGRQMFTPAVPFSMTQVKNAPKGQEHEFFQGHAFEDPGARLNPAKIGANPESGRYTVEQQARAEATKRHALRFKLLMKARSSKEKVAAKIPDPDKKRKLGEDLVEVISDAPQNTKLAKMIDDIDAQFRAAGVPDADINAIVNAELDEALSDDDDPANMFI